MYTSFFLHPFGLDVIHRQKQPTQLKKTPISDNRIKFYLIFTHTVLQNK